MPNYFHTPALFFPGEELDYALYGMYIEENYHRIEDDGWKPLSPSEFFGDFTDEGEEGSAEIVAFRNQRMWQATDIRHHHAIAMGVDMPTIIVGPAETREQAECLLMLHEVIAYLPGRISFTLTRVSALPPAPLSRLPESDEDERLAEILYETDDC